LSLRLGRRISARAEAWSEIPDWIFICVGVVCLFFAAYQSWNDEHNKVLKQLSEINDLTKPEFETSFQGIDVARVGGQNHEQPVVMLWLRIANTGTDSIACNYSLRVIRTDGSEARAQLFVLPPEITMIDIGIRLPDLESSALYNKTCESRIPRGDARNGLLAFSLPSDKPNNAYTEVGTKFEITFEDVFNKKWTATYTETPAQSFRKFQLPFLPGTPQAKPLRKTP